MTKLKTLMLTEGSMVYNPDLKPPASGENKRKNETKESWRFRFTHETAEISFAAGNPAKGRGGQERTEN